MAIRKPEFLTEEKFRDVLATACCKVTKAEGGYEAHLNGFLVGISYKGNLHVCEEHHVQVFFTNDLAHRVKLIVDRILAVDGLYAHTIADCMNCTGCDHATECPTRLAIMPVGWGNYSPDEGEHE